jgi:GT2 family glycosyltransferase
MPETIPDFSIVVPTRGRPRQLARCLEALGRLDYLGTLEIVIAADGREPGLEEAVARYGGQGRVELVYQRQAGPAAARNAGAERAQGRFLAFTDDDCAPDPDWLVQLGRRLERSPNAVVGGHTVNALAGNPYAAASQLVIDALYEHYGAGKTGGFFTTNNIALAAETFRSLDGFDESFPFPGGEDREFGDRCLERGLPLIYAPEAVVWHSHELMLGTFLRQHFTYGRGAAYFHRARFRRGLGRTTVEPRFYAVLLRLPFVRHGLRGAPLAALATLSQIAYAAGFAWQEAASRR